MTEEQVVARLPWWRRRVVRVVLGVTLAVAGAFLLDQVPGVRRARQRAMMSKAYRAEVDGLLEGDLSGERFERRLVLGWLRWQHHVRQAGWKEMSDDQRARAVRAASAIPEQRRRQLYCDWVRVQVAAIRDAIREADLAGIDIHEDPKGYLDRVHERGRLADVHASFDTSHGPISVTETGVIVDIPIDHELVDGWCRGCEAAQWLAAADKAPCLTADQLE